MRFNIYIAILLAVLVTACSGPSSKEQQTDTNTEMNQDQIIQIDNEVSRLDSVSAEIDKTKEEIDAGLDKLDEVLEEIE